MAKSSTTREARLPRPWGGFRKMGIGGFVFNYFKFEKYLIYV
jgi:hypothetical protein